MPDYGVKPEGVVIKRLDTILEEMHDDCSEGWGVNTRQNPKSYFNVLATSVADKIAELWEFGQGVYYAMYPSSAEGISLDYAGQFGGSTRERAAKTYYPIHCEAIEGTVISSGVTTIASQSNPVVNLVAAESAAITRSSFNRVKVRVLSAQAQAAYTIALDGSLYSYTSGEEPDEEQILAGLQAAITSEEFTVSVNDGLLVIEAVNVQTSHALILTENLTTETVTGIVSFASEEYGKVVLPNGVITQIVATSSPGFKSCINLCGYIAGRQKETDPEYRASYAKKIFSMSSRMIDSVKSAILDLQGVTSCSGYENDSWEWDAEGRPPHSVEFVVDGGSDAEIGNQLLRVKAGGIVPFGDVEVDVPGEEGELVTVRFNRPSYVYVWFRVVVTMSDTEALPANYIELIKEAVTDQMERVEAGKKVVPQKLLAQIYGAVSGIDYLDILAFSSDNAAAQPGEYNARPIVVSPRQRAVTDDTRIEVTLDG